MHMYDVVSSHEGRDKLSYKTERVTSFDDEQKYMTLVHGAQQEEPSEHMYQEPQQCTRNTRAAVSSDEPSDHHMLKDELKQMKRCLCVLSSLVVILFLVTILSICLAVYGSASSSQIQKAGVINSSELVSSHTFTLFKEQLNQGIHQLRNLITNLEIQINDTNVQVVSLVSLQSKVNVNISSLQTRSQPRK